MRCGAKIIKQTFVITLTDAKDDLDIMFFVKMHRILTGFDVHLPVFQQIFPHLGSATYFVFLTPFLVPGSFYSSLLS